MECHFDSELIHRIETDCKFVDGNFEDLTYYLADVEAFVEPAFVFPDIGGPINSYLCIHNVSEWPKLFENWLEQPQDFDDMTVCSSSSAGSDGHDNDDDGNSDENESQSDEGDDGGSVSDGDVDDDEREDSEEESEEESDGEESAPESDKEDQN